MKALLLLLVCLVASSANADYVLEFGAPSWCRPCREQAPAINQLKREGRDIRVVDIDEQEDLAKAWRITQVPTCIYVVERPSGSYEAARIEGRATLSQLRRFCVVPAAASVGASSRSAVRGLFTPMCYAEW